MLTERPAATFASGYARLCTCGDRARERVRWSHLLQRRHSVPAVGHPGGEVGRGRSLVVLIGLRHELRHGDNFRHVDLGSLARARRRRTWVTWLVLPGSLRSLTGGSQPRPCSRSGDDTFLRLHLRSRGGRGQGAGPGGGEATSP